MLLRYKIKVLSSLRTYPQADTIFGHICWGMKYLKGEEYLEDFLDQYEDEDIPLLVSDAFPEKHLPRPLLPPLKHKEIDNMARESKFEFMKRLKGIKKEKCISISLWKEIKSQVSERNLTIKLLALRENEFFKKEITAHNTINRNTNTVLKEGGLYFTTDVWFNKGMDIYVKFRDDDIKRLWECIWKEYIEKAGFGKDKSTGKGEIKIDIDGSFDSNIFDVEDYNCLMSLSGVAFQRWPENLNASYRLRTKYGKLGGDFAIEGSPFKKPVIMMEPGAVFYDVKDISLKDQLLKNIHTDSRIRHYGLPLTIPLRVRNE
jgi:CRISPR-associated protein Csm4